MHRVRPERRGALLALKAEGHYLQVHTDAGSDLILCRLSDALLELGADEGTQVHRSWCVASRALSTQRHRDRLVLVSGIEVPVSRSFRVQVRQRGWLRGSDAADD
jgi:DNA-binding LytR/AlgR family response regulator